MDNEDFTKSDCICEFCDSIHKSDKEWNNFTPNTYLQQRMVDIVRRIERRVEVEQSIKNKAYNREKAFEMMLGD